MEDIRKSVSSRMCCSEGMGFVNSSSSSFRSSTCGVDGSLELFEFLLDSRGDHVLSLFLVLMGSLTSTAFWSSFRFLGSFFSLIEQRGIR